MKFPKISTKNNQAFTLIELLVVIAIIGILSSVVLASLSGARESARDARRIQDLKQIQTALEMYANDHNGKYPDYPDAKGYDNAGDNDDCGWSDRWCSLANDLKPYIDPLPREPLGDTSTGPHYHYEVPNDSNAETYGLYAILESNTNPAKEDGGAYPNSSYSKVRYEVGPLVNYCTSKYDGSGEGWIYEDSNQSYCSGGN